MGGASESEAFSARGTSPRCGSHVRAGTWIVSNTIKKTITHWMPAAFCAFISLIALFGSIRSPDSGWWRPAFFAFLPMCFFFVGSATMQMHGELRELRQRITELEQRRAS